MLTDMLEDTLTRINENNFPTSSLQPNDINVSSYTFQKKEDDDEFRLQCYLACCETKTLLDDKCGAKLIIALAIHVSYHHGKISGANHNFAKIRANHDKKNPSRFTKKITHVDGMMIYNIIKYHVQIRL